jgi:V-type H+-transporting ATPase subunit a
MTVNQKGAAEVSVFKVYGLFVMREKAIYYHLNMMKQSGVVFQGLVWCPKAYNFGSVIANVINNQGLQGLNV